jgi:uncharacterized surface protein with fasciclin (FAS1) repeats
MRQSVLLFTATAVAFVAPHAANHQITQTESDDAPTVQGAVQAWWDSLPDAGQLLTTVEERIVKTAERFTLESVLAQADDDGENDDDEEEGHPRHPRPPHRGHGRHGHHRGDPTKTIYELIKENNHTTKFAKLVDEFDEIKALLQNTEHNHTLFVPTDRAFRRIPHHRHGGHGKDDKDDDDDEDKHPQKPSKEFLLDLLKYHVLPGLYPLHHIHAANTLPTELHTAALSGTSSPSSSSSSSAIDTRDHHSDHHSPQPQRLPSSTTPLLHLNRLNI